MLYFSSMAEGKIIDLFTRKRLETDSQGELVDSPALPRELDHHLNLLVLTDMLVVLTRFKQQGSLQQKNIDKRMPFVSDATNDDLFTWVNASNTQDWQKRPSFYAAVFEELNARGLTKK